MPHYKLSEDTGVQKNASKPYHFLLKEVDIFIPNDLCLSEKTPLFSKNRLPAITLYSRNEEHYFILGQAFSDYKEIHELEHTLPLSFTCKKNTKKQCLILSGDCKCFIEFLSLNHYMSDSLCQKIITLLKPIENESQENSFNLKV